MYNCNAKRGVDDDSWFMVNFHLTGCFNGSSSRAAKLPFDQTNIMAKLFPCSKHTIHNALYIYNRIEKKTTNWKNYFTPKWSSYNDHHRHRDPISVGLLVVFFCALTLNNSQIRYWWVQVKRPRDTCLFSTPAQGIARPPYNI